jgi:hypothetical protein
MTRAAAGAEARACRPIWLRLGRHHPRAAAGCLAAIGKSKTEIDALHRDAGLDGD